MSKELEKTELIDLLLSLNFKVVGHTNTTCIVEHMNFSNGNIKVILTEDNTHIFSINSDVSKLVNYEIGTKEIPVYVNPDLIVRLEPYLIPEESVVVNIINWKYQPYEERLQEAIRFHNMICNNNIDISSKKEDSSCLEALNELSIIKENHLQLAKEKYHKLEPKMLEDVLTRKAKHYDIIENALEKYEELKEMYEEVCKSNRALDKKVLELNKKAKALDIIKEICVIKFDDELHAVLIRTPDGLFEKVREVRNYDLLKEVLL